MDQLWNSAIKLGNQVQNSLRKVGLDVLYNAEVQSFEDLEKGINIPVVPLSKEENERAKWQYASQKKVNEAPVRVWEYLGAPLAIQTLALGWFVRFFSSAHLVEKKETKDDDNSNILPNGEEAWSSDDEVRKNWVFKLLRQSPPTDAELEGHAFISFTGIAWFFSTRMGCYYLKVNKKSLTTGMCELYASFEQMNKYELKPNTCTPRSVSVFFQAIKGSDPTKLPHLMVTHLIYNGIKITSDKHNTFKEAWQTLMCMALADGSLRYHGIMCHLMTGDVFTCATVRALPVDHILRPLVQNFTHNVFNTNNLLRHIVLAESGTIHTLFPFSWNGVCEYTKDTFSSFSIWKDLYEPWSQSSAPLRQANPTMHFVSSAIPVMADAFLLWDMFEKYISDYLRAVHLSNDSQMQSNAEINSWIQEVASQQPNDASRLEIETLWTERPLECVKRLLTIFMFHSTVTHDISALTKEIVATPFAVPTMIFDGDAPNKRISGKHTGERAMVASFSTSLEVPLLKQPWGDLMLPNVDSGSIQQQAKTILNSLSSRLEEVEYFIRNTNQKRYFVSDGLFPSSLKCSISV